MNFWNLLGNFQRVKHLLDVRKKKRSERDPPENVHVFVPAQNRIFDLTRDEPVAYDAQHKKVRFN